MSKSKDQVVRTIKTIPINEIRYLNPRVRNRRNFQEIVQSIAKVGLKRPITVSPRKTEADSASYDLACGQGRIGRRNGRLHAVVKQHPGVGMNTEPASGDRRCERV